MIQFTAEILKFKEQGEKTGWTYIEIPANIASKLKPNNKKSFRVKGKLDNHSIEKVALLPMGEGEFIIPINAAMRKGIRKTKGATLNVALEEDPRQIELNPEFMDCLADEPRALEFFNSLSKSHKSYFSKWIDSAKTDVTKAKRIAESVNGLAQGKDFGRMLRERNNGDNYYARWREAR